MKWKRFLINVLDNDDEELSSIIKLTKPTDFKLSYRHISIPEPYFKELEFNPRKVLHRSLIFLSPEYRYKNGYPHEVDELTDEMIKKYDSCK